MEEAIIYAKKYLEDILSFFGLNTDVYATEEDGVIELVVPSTHLNGFLIGHNADTLRALQFVVMSALRNQNYEYSHVNIDIADYKKNRANKVVESILDIIEKVKKEGGEYELRPMNAADRRAVHKAVDEAGLTTVSIGEGKDRRVVIKALAE